MHREWLLTMTLEKIISFHSLRQYWKRNIRHEQLFTHMQRYHLSQRHKSSPADWPRFWKLTRSVASVAHAVKNNWILISSRKSRSETKLQKNITKRDLVVRARRFICVLCAFVHSDGVQFAVCLYFLAELFSWIFGSLQCSRALFVRNFQMFGGSNWFDDSTCIHTKLRTFYFSSVQR